MPFDPEVVDVADVISTLETTLDESGTCSAKIGELNVSIETDGSWSVTRLFE